MSGKEPKMACPTCNAEIATDENYCHKCGSSIGRAAPALAEQLEAQLGSGTRLVIYHYTISLLILSSRRPSEVFLIRRGDSRFFKGMPYTLCSLLLGWWGLPWGPIFTVWSVIENLAGGEDVTEKVKKELEKQHARRMAKPTTTASRSPRKKGRLERTVSFFGIEFED